VPAPIGSTVPDVATDDLTLQQAADQLGVHYMTVYRYVRLGLLTAVKSGGTWRVSVADLDAFRAGSATSPQPEGGGRRRVPWADRLESRLLVGDSRGAWGVVESAMAAGNDLDEIYTDVLSPALVSIGERWERGELDISIEHRATGIVMRLIGRLGPRFVRRGRTRGSVVIGAPTGEMHSLPIALLSDLVRKHGWEVSDLGADVPASAFVHATLTTPDTVAVGVSVTFREHLPAAASAVAAVREAAPHVLVVVGGYAVQNVDDGLAIGAHAVALDAKGFVALLDDVRVDSARTDEVVEH
jgi:excisionase family DNA binding protein